MAAEPETLSAVSRCYLASQMQPLLMHTYLPRQPFLDFAAHGLPRAVPILPLLIRSGLYIHDAAAARPGIHSFAAMLAAALQKRIRLHGIDIRDLECLPTTRDLLTTT